jgi:hypothetical protein
MPTKRRQFTSEEQAKLAALREEINRAYEQGGGTYTDEEVGASIEAQLDAWEKARKA